MKKKIILIFLIFICLKSNAQVIEEVSQLKPPLEGARGIFGVSFDIDNNFAILGAPREIKITRRGDTLTNAGAAYVYRKTRSGKWRRVQRLEASKPIAFNGFGSTVAISGNYAVLGATQQSGPKSKTGIAYVFKKNRRGIWKQIQVLIGSKAKPGDNFGFSVDINRNKIMIGAPGITSPDFPEGSVYVFRRSRRNKWIQTQQIHAEDRTLGDGFGYRVKIERNRAIISTFADADDNDPSITLVGSAYIFEKKNNRKWRQKQKLTASDRMEFDRFGASVKLQGDYAFISADLESDGDATILAGAVYVFKRRANGTWIETQKVTPSKRFELAAFGDGLDVQDDIMIVGSTFPFSGSTNSGVLNVFIRNKQGVWLEKQVVNPSNNIKPSSGFGRTIIIDGDIVFVNAPFANDDEGVMTIYNINDFRVEEQFNEGNMATKLLVYPVPTYDILTLNSGSVAISDVQIIDFYGTIYKSESITTIDSNAITTDVSGLTSGVYIAKVTTSDDKVTQVRFIKH